MYDDGIDSRKTSAPSGLRLAAGKSNLCLMCKVFPSFMLEDIIICMHIVVVHLILFQSVLKKNRFRDLAPASQPQQSFLSHQSRSNFSTLIYLSLFENFYAFHEPKSISFMFSGFIHIMFSCAAVWCDWFILMGDFIVDRFY